MRIIFKLLYLLRIVIYHIINFLNSVFPKNRYKIFFYDSEFRKDNMWALLKHIENKGLNSKYQVVYFTSNSSPKSFHKVKNISFIGNNVLGLYHQLTSKYVFWGFGTYRFTCKPKKGQIIANLWHGSPLKKIGYLIGENPWYQYYESFSYIICASDFFKNVLKKCFDFKDGQGIILGAPRNDLLFANKDVISLLNIDRQKYTKIIMFMPTFRKSTQHNYFDSNINFPILDHENIKDLNSFLEDRRLLLIIQPHPYQEKLAFLNVNHHNICVLWNEDLEAYNIELYELLGQIDFLITDYSSVYFDFLLTQKPIGFVLEDIEVYKKNRGFVVENPMDLMPGEKIYNYHDFIQFIENGYKGIDLFKEQRQTINMLANKYQDGNCQRLLDFFQIY